MTYHRMETNEGDRFYRASGIGEPIVLLHCSSGSSGAWLPVMHHLGQDYRVLAPDLLGYGRNAPWARGAELAPGGELGVVDALLDIADRPVHVVGHSYGGTIALDAARRFRGQIATLTLIEPVAFHLLRCADEPDGWCEIAALAERHLALVGEGQDAAAAEAFIAYWMGPRAWQSMPDAARDGAVRTAAKVAAEWRLMFAAKDDLEAIATIEAPTLLVWGERTRTPARRVIEVLGRTLPQACQHQIIDAGHNSPLTHPAAVADAIRSHLASTDPQRRSAA